MSFTALSHIKTLLEVELLGSTYLLGLFLIVMIWLLMSMARIPQKVNLLILAPVIFSFAIYALIPYWVYGATALLIGFALAALIWKIYTGLS